ncbi:MAG: tetratricopeptide repeat protein, partial [Zavarzinella sp.]|nr:tetratricopeptide repeat protein [Zavarzinella sp.]
APGPADGYHDGLELALTGKPAEALVKLIPYTDEHPDHFLAWYARGASHEAVAQYPDAAAAFTVCATLWPDFAPTYFGRGYSRLKQGKVEAAEADFTRALRHRPDWADALLNRAIARDARKDYAGAEADLTAALALPGAPTRIYFLRARARKALGNTKGEAEDLAEGYKRPPADDVSWVTRGVRLLETDPRAALADYEEALKLNPKSKDALVNKAVALADHLNRPADAANALDRLLEFCPTYTDARAGRGVYLARCGDAKRATADAAQVLKEDPTPYRLFQMAGVYAQLSKADKPDANKQEALKLIAQSLRAGFSNFDKLDRDPDLDPIRDDPAFRSIVDHARKLRTP